MDSVEIRTATKILKFLGNETRLKLLGIIMYNDCSVTELASILKMNENIVRNQVLKLKDSGVVNYKVGGSEPLFSINQNSDFFEFVKLVLEALPWTEDWSELQSVGSIK
ncbi:winged helix-turn-helix domain-containing protein [Mesobacillus maritimus]|uniref:winged helix-turn-helix domain-containing protein n=1 Tax=Mesobacillus maritimus TaxID=1643336 RepID=UPI00203F9436|nr:winged helix-turn-helix domain-containing protein [Mesobacillus maritimus]MCM3668998.1 winged helix-turn-helix domain-containing protein [Mesobacillus maritimus]